MRLQLHLTPNTEPVPYDHLHKLTGAVHKWLGPNDVHNGQSLYSFGWLRGGESRGNNLRFPQGATWNISMLDDEKGRELLKGLLDDPTWAYGMEITEVREVNPPNFRDRHYFYTDGSAVVIRQKRDDGSKAYLLWDNPAVDDALTISSQRKLALVGLTDNELAIRVSFDRAYQQARSRKITIKGIHHRGSECPVEIEGTPDALYVLWTVGLGDLTGSGFGALR